MITKPDLSEYPEFYHTYIGKLPENVNITDLLRQQPEDLYTLLHNLTEEEAERGYAPGKWSIKELLGHLMDAERIFAYRALCISRKELQSLPGFDENDYVKNSNFNQQPLNNLLQEYSLLRAANIMLFQSFTPEMLRQIGFANNNPITVNAIVAITAAHEYHHLGIIKERYLKVQI